MQIKVITFSDSGFQHPYNIKRISKLFEKTSLEIFKIALQASNICTEQGKQVIGITKSIFYREKLCGENTCSVFFLIYKSLVQVDTTSTVQTEEIKVMKSSKRFWEIFG